MRRVIVLMIFLVLMTGVQLVDRTGLTGLVIVTLSPIVGVVVVLVRRYSKRGQSEIVQKQLIPTYVKVLVICPFCSTKSEQGTSFCPNCGGKL